MAAPTALVPRQPVVSSNIESYGYDQDRRILAVEFKSGAIFHYLNVPVDAWDALCEAASKGRFFHASIKGKFVAQKMTGHCSRCGDQGPIGELCTDCGTDNYVEDPKVETRTEFEPTRVLCDDEGLALNPARAKRECGIVPDVIFVRNDGWSLGAPKRLRRVAQRQWAGSWIERWEKSESGYWMKLWPLPASRPAAQ